jgi:hypothetical protein
MQFTYWLYGGFMRKLLMVFLAIGFASNSWSETPQVQCEEIISKLAPVMTTATSTKALQAIKAADPSVVVLGEYHYDHLFWKMPHVYQYFKKLMPKINCLYSEISQDATQEQIDEMIEGKTNEVFYSVRRLGFGPLYQSVYNLGDQVILVDAPKAEISYRPDNNFSSWITRRDSFMISRIDTSLAQNECSAGIYNVGAQHIWDNLGSDPSMVYESFGTRIKKNRKAVVIDKGELGELSFCEHFQGMKSFIAPASNKVVRDVFKLDEKKSSADYVLYLKSSETLHALSY